MDTSLWQPGNDVRDAEVERAIARVLEAEREAAAMLDATRRASLASVERARLGAADIGARARRRIQVVQQAFDRLVEQHRVRVEAQIIRIGQFDDPAAGSAMANSTDLVRALVAELIGGND